MRITAFLNLLITSSLLYAQEYLAPLGSNPALLKANIRTLGSRSSHDSVNNIVEYETLSLPFIDDFSSDNTRPLSFSTFPVIAEQYIIGSCVPNLGFKLGYYPFSKIPSTTDVFDVTNPPNYSSPNPNTPIVYIQDTPNCNIQTLTSIYPPFRYRRYDNVGNLLFDSIASDTSFYAAHIKKYFLKGYLWIDRYAYINRHIAYLPPSKGVATLDGLNEYGRPYNNDITNAYGQADYLTSAPIDLTGFRAADSVYLSFMYQPQGFGNWPNTQDSLLVEMLDDRGRWNTVWVTKGLQSRIDMDILKFKHILIAIPDPIVPSDPFYFHPNFQFRFRNYATISGNNDHWHIDFVKLDTGRHYQDTFIQDANFVYDLPTVLKNYTLLPYKQYRGAIDLKDTIEAINRNLVSGTFNAYKYTAYNQNTGAIYGNNSAGVTFAADPIVYHKLDMASTFSLPNSVSDSTYIVSKIYFDASDNFITNDTATHSQFFYNEMAYDDGTAEEAYGIEGSGIKKVAYRYIVPNQDTLAAIKILFSNIDVPVSSLVFNLTIWKKIGMNGNKEEIIKAISNQKPKYLDTLNGFVTFGLDTPIIVQDTIYVGWVQSDERNIQIGYDKNSTLGFDHIFIMTNNVWSKSNQIRKGSPMMRLILDGHRKYSANIIGEKKDESNRWTTSIYPNPASDYFEMSATEKEDIQIEIYNLIGNKVYSQEIKSTSRIDISHLIAGVYICRFVRDGQFLHYEKLKIQR